MAVVSQVIYVVLWLFFIALLARLVFDWVFLFARSWEPKGPVLFVLEAVYTLTDPPWKAVRKVVTPLKLGSVALDLAFIVLIIAVQIALTIVGSAR